jgi:hypothetical protein
MADYTTRFVNLAVPRCPIPSADRAELPPGQSDKEVKLPLAFPGAAGSAAFGNPRAIAANDRSGRP